MPIPSQSLFQSLVQCHKCCWMRTTLCCHWCPCEFKSHPEECVLPCTAKKKPPRSGFHRRGRSPRAPASQCCSRGMGCPELRKTSTISAAQYTTCKSPTLRCGGAGADPPASVPAPWYFFSAVHGMHMSCLAHGSTAHPATATARPQPGHSQVTVRSQSGHSQVTVRSWFFHRESLPR